MREDEAVKRVTCRASGESRDVGMSSLSHPGTPSLHLHIGTRGQSLLTPGFKWGAHPSSFTVCIAMGHVHMAVGVFGYFLSPGWRGVGPGLGEDVAILL